MQHSTIISFGVLDADRFGVGDEARERLDALLAVVGNIVHTTGALTADER